MAQKNKAVTLLEIVIVVILLGIIAAVGLPGLTTMRERAIDKEARANLMLVQAAQRIYLMEEALYYPIDGSTETNLTKINNALRLSLSGANWDFSVTGGSDFEGNADRNNVTATWDRAYYVDELTGQACCCPKAGASASACLSQDKCTSPPWNESCPPTW